jgi:hypothetical protein
MCNSNSFTSLLHHQVEYNLNQGCYTPKFFELEEYGLSKISINSTEYSSGNAEKELLIGDHSFAYLREDKVRTIDAYHTSVNKIPFNDFTTKFGVRIKSNNLFKTGKYLSRVFRPVRYAGHFKNIKIHINHNPKLMGKVTDGISLISLSLAKVLGWGKAEAGMSAQFTFFFEDGLVKGNCVISDKIHHDVIVYGNENIKTEISLGNGIQYISLEPLKLSNTLRMDIQSLLNLWNLFGAEQYLDWAYKGIVEFKSDLMSGKLNNWLDDFDELDAEAYETETWTLRQAIRHKLDYTRFPGLVRQGWTMFRSGMRQFALSGKGEPKFRIPVPGGLRGYIRVDLRDHDSDGNFTSNKDPEVVHLDKFGNLWIHPDSVIEFMEVKGGADMDDGVAIIPVENDQAVIYRNPNQFGEYGIHKISYENITVDKINKLVGTVTQKTLNAETQPHCINEVLNPLLQSYINKLPAKVQQPVEYVINNLLKTLFRITNNSASIGLAANAEMIRSAIGISDPELFKKLFKDYNWNLERIIDSTVKEGVSASSDMEAVSNLINYIVENHITVPKALSYRFSKKLRSELNFYESHPLDNLLDAIKYFLDEADIEILGKGSASRGNRIKGIIDNLEIPLQEIGLSAISNPLSELASSLLKNYNRKIAILLEKSKDMELAEREIQRQEGIERIQEELLVTLSVYNEEDRQLLVQHWAYEIYRSEKAPHDSILWIGDKDNLSGTTMDTIKMLAALGIAYNVQINATQKSRTIIKKKFDTSLNQVRVWSKNNINSNDFDSVTELLVVKKEAVLGDKLLNIGDENEIEDGLYKIKTIVQSQSKKNKSLLKNSLTIYLS